LARRETAARRRPTRRAARRSRQAAAARKLDDGGALQLDVGCDPEGQRAVWVDFRDPPSRESTFSGKRVGGDIYLYAASTKKVTRLTTEGASTADGGSTIMT
jgi:hypothetical protein